MQKLNFDTGLKEFECGGGILRFNPSDPNVFARFVESTEKLLEIEKRLVDSATKLSEEAAPGKVMLQLMADADKEAKEMLHWIFGADNDFNAIFHGANIMAVGENGERVITNFLNAIRPIMEKGAKKCAKQQVENAVNKSKMNRAQRRAAGKKR